MKNEKNFKTSITNYNNFLAFYHQPIPNIIEIDTKILFLLCDNPVLRDC